MTCRLDRVRWYRPELDELEAGAWAWLESFPARFHFAIARRSEVAAAVDRGLLPTANYIMAE